MLEKKFLYFGIVMFTLGLVFFALFFKEVTKTRNFIKSASKAKGIVVSLTEHEILPDPKSKDILISSSYVYTPKIVFKDSLGKEHNFTSRLSQGRDEQVQEGSEVQVLYSPSDPTHAVIDSFIEIWFKSLMWLFMGSVLFIIGSTFLYRVITMGIL